MQRASGDEYDEAYERKAAAGENVHGEADFVMRFSPQSVLDAGCGTGRVAAELARRGVAAVGVDSEPDMIAAARGKAPDSRHALTGRLPPRFTFRSLIDAAPRQGAGGS